MNREHELHEWSNITNKMYYSSHSFIRVIRVLKRVKQIQNIKS